MNYRLVLLIIICTNFICQAMENQITNASFEFNKKAKALKHTLEVAFCGEHESKQPVSTVTFEFLPLEGIPDHPAYTSYLSDCIRYKAQGVVDLCPVNGSSKKRITKIFDNRCAREMEKELLYLHQQENVREFSSYPKLFVLDIKDKNKKYDDIDDIGETENNIAHFLQNPKEMRPMHQQIENGDIRYFIKEGSLKAMLIQRVLGKKQNEFFQGVPKGRMLLCQLCEFIMNGFKRGYQVIGYAEDKSYCFHPAIFFDFAQRLESLPTSKAQPRLSEQILKQPLCTLYSGTYEGVYNEDGEYTTALKSLWNVETNCDKPNKIIGIIQRPKEEL